VAPGKDHLQRDIAAGADLPRQVNDSHAAAAQFAEDFVAGNERLTVAARRRRHGIMSHGGG